MSKYIVQLVNTAKPIVTAFDNDVLAKNITTLDLLTSCNHEEADTRVFLHAKLMSDNGIKAITIKTVDTDVVVIAISQFWLLNLDELWIEFGSGKDQMMYPIHQLSHMLGKDKSEGLLFIHAFTGCDQTSFLYHCKKKTAWMTWTNYEEATEAFKILSNKPSKEDVLNCMDVLERFVILMYDKTCNTN